ncbi:2-dehydro-3-deoxyphosphooctonate aldolase [Bacteroidia bacterium]|nr:2-dehydro-3-deoxyphosphooctonate aldolase [Bacteroidia bacterium]
MRTTHSIIPPVTPVNIANRFSVGTGQPLCLIAGPCVVESLEMSLLVANTLKKLCKSLGINYIFKSSFDKANRSSFSSRRGLGMDAGLKILQAVHEQCDVPVLTDVHETWQCKPAAAVADVLQIPAFLVRQTDLLQAAAKTGKAINVKKGQFMAPWDMKNVVEKLQEANNTQSILLCERGTSFGYNSLIVDMTGLVEMRKLGYPIVFDATHSVQEPGGEGTFSGGNRAMIPPLMRAAIGVGIDALFAEVHPDPDNAWSDAANQLSLDTISQLLTNIVALDKTVKSLS